MVDVLKIFGVNGTVLGVVTLTDIELILKITLLLITIIWTTFKAASEYKKWLNG